MGEISDYRRKRLNGAKTVELRKKKGLKQASTKPRSCEPRNSTSQSPITVSIPASSDATAELAKRDDEIVTLKKRNAELEQQLERRREGMTIMEAAIEYADLAEVEKLWKSFGLSGTVSITEVEKWRKEVSTGESGIGEWHLYGALLKKLERGELLGRGFKGAGRQLVDIPPAAWEATSFPALKANMASDWGGSRFTSVRIIPMPEPGDAVHRDAGRYDHDIAVAMYREYHKAHGKNPDDANTKPPTFEEDLTMSKRLLSVPQKVLQGIRQEVWGDRIKIGRPRKILVKSAR